MAEVVKMDGPEVIRRQSRYLKVVGPFLVKGRPKSYVKSRVDHIIVVLESIR